MPRRKLWLSIRSATNRPSSRNSATIVSSISSLGLATYSLQNHLRTQLDGIQLEIDELYVGIGQSGAQYINSHGQGQGGNDRIGRIQLEQDSLCPFCPSTSSLKLLTCRPVAAQFLDDETIALFELTIDNEHVRIVEERHYKLCPGRGD